MGLIYYFGKTFAGYGGHELQGEDGFRVLHHLVPVDFPCSVNMLDCGLLPPRMPETQGRATLVHLNGWTILTFWDRSGDKRGQSCSAFVLCGTLDFDAVIRVSKARYPKVWERIDFDVVLFNPQK